MSVGFNGVRSAELRTTDLLPECPRCNELCDPEARVCAECGTRLFLGPNERLVFKRILAATDSEYEHRIAHATAITETVLKAKEKR